MDLTSGPHKPAYLIEIDQLRADAAVHAEDAFGHEGGYRQAAEHVSEGLPQLYPAGFYSSLACQSGSECHSVAFKCQQMIVTF